MGKPKEEEKEEPKSPKLKEKNETDDETIKIVHSNEPELEQSLASQTEESSCKKTGTSHLTELEKIAIETRPLNELYSKTDKLRCLVGKEIKLTEEIDDKVELSTEAEENKPVSKVNKTDEMPEDEISRLNRKSAEKILSRPHS